MVKNYDIPLISLRIVRDGSIASPKIIRSPLDIATLLMERFQDADRENFVIVHLSTRNEMQSIEVAFVGSLNAAHIRIADVFKAAIIANSAAIIIAHNHPSGDPSPSPEDVALTRQIVEAGELLDIEVLDHIVIGNGRFVSLKERGLGFK